MAVVAHFVATQLLSYYGGFYEVVVFAEMKPERYAHGSVPLYYEFHYLVRLLWPRGLGRDERRLVGKRDAGPFLEAARPRGYGLEVAYHHVVIGDGKIVHVPEQLVEAGLLYRGVVVDSAVFPEDESEPPQAVLHLEAEIYLVLALAYQYVDLGRFPKLGYHVPRAAYVAVSGSLYGVEYFQLFSPRA